MRIAQPYEKQMSPNKIKPRIIANVMLKSSTSEPKKSNALQKKLQDLRKLYATKKKKSEQLEAALKSAKVKIKDLKLMNNKLTGLNIELQKTVISYVKQLTDEENMVSLKPHKNIINSVPAVGYIREHDKKIHLGEEVWLEKTHYHLCVYILRKSYQSFVKNLALAIFGPKLLKNSSVIGSVSRQMPNKAAYDPRTRSY
ncbi:uncharacterized protein LOC113005549 [Solenopsis invicta]|uniref:uncharacterized protein LOC113005549 n=1 Tax=Solenopsis invicta TaxID=13686 RepID=UPI000E33EE90|nr:uncharacterized protein LOC113005549 [Solenopsis invicta]